MAAANAWMSAASVKPLGPLLHKVKVKPDGPVLLGPLDQGHAGGPRHHSFGIESMEEGELLVRNVVRSAGCRGVGAFSSIPLGPKVGPEELLQATER